MIALSLMAPQHPQKPIRNMNDPMPITAYPIDNSVSRLTDKCSFVVTVAIAASLATIHMPTPRNTTPAICENIKTKIIHNFNLKKGNKPLLRSQSMSKTDSIQ